MERLVVKDLLPGDILLYHGTGLIARLIRFFDGTEMNHAAVYLGEGRVGEALAQGLVRQTLAKSLRGTAYVAVRRLKAYPETMEPVVDKARSYLALGNRYAYDQLLLLAFLGLTRKLPVNAFLKWLLRKIFDQAASWLTAQGERQPMICSEFVYRCYDEALPTEGDPYALEIAPLTRLRTGVPKTRTLPAAWEGKTHRDSLLFWTREVCAQGRRRKGKVQLQDGKKGPEKGIQPPPAAEEGKAAGLGLEALIENYLEAVKRPVPRSRALEASLRGPELLEGITRFALAWRKIAGPPPGKGRKGGKASSKEEEIAGALDFLWDTVADFVTPGDLLKCEDLFTLGNLAPKGR